MDVLDRSSIARQAPTGVRLPDRSTRLLDSRLDRAFVVDAAVVSTTLGRMPESSELSSSSRPPVRTWLPSLVVLAIGVFFGLGAFTFGYGDGGSYLRDDPASCANCHVMQMHYDSWVKSSHRDVATCNDCHLMGDPIGKWVTKADNGFFHSLAFTTGNFAEPIQIKPRNRRVTQHACLDCHSDYVHALLPPEPGGEMVSCVHCHQSVGHAQR